MKENKLTHEEIIKALECCISDDCDNCPDTFGNCEHNAMRNALDLINRQQAEIENADFTIKQLTKGNLQLQAEIERLTTIAKKMHSWIFTNSYDEEKAYAECGLTDEENTLLGYCGKIVFESKEMVGEQE